MRQKQLALLAVGFFVFAISPLTLPANPTQLAADLNSDFVVSPEQQFKEALRIAQNGDVPGALELANRTLTTFSSDVRIKLAYIESLVQMQKLQGNQLDEAILNDAIRVANEVEGVTECNGSRDPSLGFGYLRALGELAYAVEATQPKICIQLKYVIGNIAENLLDNPRVAKESHKYLALPYFDKARAHANRGEEQLAAESLQVAFKLGFSDLDRVQEVEIFKTLKNADEIEKIIEDGNKIVAQQKEAWAQNQIASFTPFVYVFNVDGLNDNQITNNDFQGKILVVDLWATWCPPCKKGIPHFKRLQDEFGDKNVQVLGISVDNPDSPLNARIEVQEFVKEISLNYPCGLGGHSVINQVPGETSLPTTLFIDGNGNVKTAIRGYHSYADLKALTEQMIKMTETN